MQSSFLLFFNPKTNLSNTFPDMGLLYRSLGPRVGLSGYEPTTQKMEQFMGNPKERVGTPSYGTLCRPNPGNVLPATPWSTDIINTKQPTEDRTQRWVSNPDELSTEQSYNMLSTQH